ncbi:hypothetical protein CYMTET_53152 [Cymbomonas tetramitiformis]|uniref:Uncharacterized protein n=1 Tax=Cymbomonas tetramitiformis TaxID=36881 RepID=A0AAE0EQM7_9CHLO|nr:hypothetical protein CYMTET_53152 [Cymbomonas tetramitiformis]
MIKSVPLAEWTIAAMTSSNTVIAARQFKRLICSRAARGGHLEVLQWARTHGCPWNEDTCMRTAGRYPRCRAMLRMAARGMTIRVALPRKKGTWRGHLEALKLARTHGCPWNENTLRLRAAGGGHPEVSAAAHTHGCPWNEDAVCVGAGAYGGKS